MYLLNPTPRRREGCYRYRRQGVLRVQRRWCVFLHEATVYNFYYEGKSVVSVVLTAEMNS
jgi:hypothetical protein